MRRSAGSDPGDAEDGRSLVAGFETRRAGKRCGGEWRRDKMNWEVFFLVCFGVGLVSTLVSFFAGALHLHLPTKFHMGHHGHIGGHGAHAPGNGLNVSHISAFNLPTIMAFLAWFGGVGYMMTHNLGFGVVESLVASLAGGFV